MINTLLGGAASWKKLTGSNNDDSADRLSHLWTVLLLSVFAVFVTTSQLVGDPISCWFPDEFSSAREKYVKDICWISNTYYISMDEPIPKDTSDRKKSEVQYYQWVPLIFMFMALMFKLPNLVWRALSDGSGVNLDKIVEMAENTQLGSSEDREKSIRHVALYMDRWLSRHQRIPKTLLTRFRHKMSTFFCDKREGTYLTRVYVTTKILYLLNTIAQFFLLNSFLSMDYSTYGFEVIAHLFKHGKLLESPRFPRITLCDFHVRQLANVQPWTVQCVLPINLFNEKIFAFLWFWLVLVAIFTSLNLFQWLYGIVFRFNRGRYIRNYLRMLDQIADTRDKALSQKFANKYLKDDGIFVLRVVGKNSTDLVVIDLVSELWKIFKKKPDNAEPEQNMDVTTISIKTSGS